MLLSVTQAAQLLGQTRRQVEYQIKQGRLKATKVGGRWQVDEADLPLGPKQRQARQRRADGLRDAAAEVLDAAAPRGRYSMTQLGAFTTMQGVWRDAAPLLAADHPARPLLRQALDGIAVGCHRYIRAEKAAAYSAARDALSRAACALLLDGTEAAVALAARIEHDGIPALGGLLRRAQAKRP
jgi:excisionase family DNA binding protein